MTEHVRSSDRASGQARRRTRGLAEEAGSAGAISIFNLRVFIKE